MDSTSSSPLKRQCIAPVAVGVPASPLDALWALAKTFGADRPLGTANIAFVLAVIRVLAGSECAEQIAAKLAPDAIDGYLRDPERVACLIVNEDKDIRKSDDVVSALGAHIEKLVSLPCEPQVNALVERVTELKDVFKPNSLIPAGAKLRDVALIAVAAEKIKITWAHVMGVKDATFTDAAGVQTQHKFATTGDKFETMDLVRIGSTCMGALIKTDAPDRYMLVAVPPQGQTPSSLVEALAAGVYTVQLGWFKARVCFPFLDAKMPEGGVSIVPNLVNGMGIDKPFSPTMRPFDGTIVDKDGGIPFVSDVVHYATFEADNMGATAKAATAAPVIVFRSMGPPQHDINADRPFLAAIVKLVDGKKLMPEFVLKVESAAALQ